MSSATVTSTARPGRRSRHPLNSPTVKLMACAWKRMMRLAESGQHAGMVWVGADLAVSEPSLFSMGEPGRSPKSTDRTSTRGGNHTNT